MKAKKAISLLSKTTTLHRSAHASHFLMHFSPLLHHDHNVKFASKYSTSNFDVFFFPDGLTFPADVRRFVSSCCFFFLSECFVLIYLAERVYFSPVERPVTVSVCVCGVAILDFETKQGMIGWLQNVISRVGIRCSSPPAPPPFLPPRTCVPQSERILVLVPPLPQAALNTNATGTLLFT